ncbi:hypothetical protein [Mycolicibacterium lutetiense]
MTAPTPLHAVAEHTDRHLLPDVVANLLDRNDQRKATRAHTWHQHLSQEWATHDDQGSSAHKNRDQKKKSSQHHPKPH